MKLNKWVNEKIELINNDKCYEGYCIVIKASNKVVRNFLLNNKLRILNVFPMNSEVKMIKMDNTTVFLNTVSPDETDQWEATVDVFDDVISELGYDYYNKGV